MIDGTLSFTEQNKRHMKKKCIQYAIETTCINLTKNMLIAELKGIYWGKVRVYLAVTYKLLNKHKQSKYKNPAICRNILNSDQN